MSNSILLFWHFINNKLYSFYLPLSFCDYSLWTMRACLVSFDYLLSSYSLSSLGQFCLIPFCAIHPLISANLNFKFYQTISIKECVYLNDGVSNEVTPLPYLFNNENFPIIWYLHKISHLKFSPFCCCLGLLFILFVH